MTQPDDIAVEAEESANALVPEASETEQTPEGDSQELAPEQDAEQPAPEDDGEQPAPEEDGDELAEQEGDARRRGIYLTPRQTFIAMAAALGVVLAVLVAYLIWLSLPADFTQRGGKAQEGIIPEFSMYGPARGTVPRFDTPMAAAWGEGDGVIYVADTKNNRVVVFDGQGRFKRTIGSFGIAKPLPGVAPTWKPGMLDYPTDVDTDRQGNVYVADFYNDSISVFDKDGKYLRRFPDPNNVTGYGGSGQGGTGIAVTAIDVQGDKVYATDTYQVLVFSTGGKLLKQFGKPGLGPADLDHPGGIAADRDGRIYVADSNHNRVVAFSPDGEMIWSTGRVITDLRKETDNPFVLPRGLTILKDGSLLVADPLGQQLVKLDADGKVIAHYGMRGADPGQLNFPNDVSVSGERILVADRENDRVQVVRLADR